MINMICLDPRVMEMVRNIATLPGEIPINPVSPSEDLVRLMFVGTGWQLTMFGFAFMVNAYKSYSVGNQDNRVLKGRILVNLGRIVNGPWNVHGPTVHLWDQTSYFELSMFDGSLDHYVGFHAGTVATDQKKR